VLFPVALAIFLSFVLSPLVARLERLRIGRVPSVVVVSVLAFATIGSVGWLVGRQAMDIVVHMPEYRSNLQSKLEVVREKVARPLNQANDAVHQIADGGEETPATKAPVPASNAFDLGSLSNGLGAILSALATAGVVALLVILMLAQRGELRDRFVALVGGSGLIVTTQALDEGSRRLGRYLLAVTAINALQGAAVGIGLASSAASAVTAMSIRSLLTSLRASSSMRWISGYDITPLCSSLRSKYLSVSTKAKSRPSSIMVMRLSQRT
jgi:predicted PurR-regulated permease PerM